MRCFFMNVHWDCWVEADTVIVCRSIPLFHTQLVFKMFHCQVGSSWVKIKEKKYFSGTCAGAYLGLIWQFGCFHTGYVFFCALEKGEEILSPWTCLVPAFFAAVLHSFQVRALDYAQSFVKTMFYSQSKAITEPSFPCLGDSVSDFWKPQLET